MTLRIVLLSTLGALAGFSMSHCAPTSPNVLDALGTADLPIKGHAFRLWIADGFDEVSRGLMFVTEEEMADLSDGTRRGMIFVFPAERQLGFWMKNTIIPLDIAYLDSDGVVVRTYTMQPLTTNQYSSVEPAQFAIEVNAGVWSQIGLNAGDKIELPASIRPD